MYNAAVAYREAGLSNRCWEIYRQLVDKFPGRFSLNSGPCAQ